MLMKKIIGSVLILFLSWLIIFHFPNWVFLLLVIMFIGLGLYELSFMVEQKGIFVYKYFELIAGILIPVSIYLHLGGNCVDLEPLLIVIACLFTFVLQFIKRESNKDHLASIAVTLLGLFYISWFFSFFVKIKFLPNGNGLVAFLILTTKSGDVGAYFFGKRFGRHKLIPRISPNKTKEGTLGGILVGIGVALLSRGLVGLPAGHILFLGLFLGILGQVGDLAESLIKRDCGVKDAGRTLSGFGGVLDMIDSLLFTAPIFYFYVIMLG